MRVARLMILVILVPLLVACGGNDRAQKCREARDRMIPLQEEMVAKTLASVDAEMAQKLRAQADKELALFKDRFVDACTKAKAIDFKCFEVVGSSSKECNDKHRALWAEVYGEPEKATSEGPTSEEVTPAIRRRGSAGIDR